MKMISKTNLSVSGTDGVAIFMTAGEAREVPECLYVAAMTAGAAPVDADEAPAPTTYDPARASLLVMAVQELIAGNDESKFKTDGTPRVDAVSAIAGLSGVTTVEVAAAFDAVASE